MIGPHNKRKQLIKEACEITYGPIDETLRLTGLGGKVTGNELQRIADHHRTSIDTVRRRALSLGIQIGEGKQENHQALYTKYYSQKPDNAAVFDQMSQYLTSFSVESLYEFLSDGTPGAGFERSSCDDLRKKAEEKRKKEFYRNDARSTAGQRLCGYCESAFKDETSKAVYDNYLLYTRTKTLLDKVKSQYKISGRLSEELSEKFVADLTEVLKERKLANEVLAAFCEVEKISYTLPRSSPEGSFTSDEPFFTATDLDNLAVNLAKQGRDLEAEPLLKKALEIREKELGIEHPMTATSLNNLVACLNVQGKYAEAKKVRERYQKGSSSSDHFTSDSSSNKHLDTVTDLNKRADNLDRQGRYFEAEPLYRKALEIREKELGPEHPDTIISLHNLTVCLSRQDRDSEAEPLYKRALEIKEKVFGPEHPETVLSLNNLANNVGSQGRYPEAERLLKRILDIRERTLGQKHPNTALSLKSLAVNVDNQERYLEAEPLFRRALAIREKEFGSKHPNTAQSLNDLAVNLDNQARYSEAEPLFKKALEIYEKVFGPEDPDTVQSLENLTVTLYNQGKHSEAEKISERYRR
jgi:tetratricopeptide (TPR) repeat protein